MTVGRRREGARTGSMEWVGTVGTRCRDAARGRREVLLRAVRRPGPERDALLLQAKGAAAAATAWWLASWLLPSTVTAFAAFTALLALQSTVYRSLLDSAQYLGAMALGTGVAAAFGSTAGVHAWSVAVLAFVALTGARLNLLGRQSTQVPVVALFAFAGGGGEIDYIGHLVAAASIGVCCGLAAHVAIAPSPHTDTAEEMTGDLAARAQDLLRTLACAAAGEGADEASPKEGERRCEELAREAVRVRATVDKEQENTRLNPRRPWSSAEDTLQRCQDTISMIERVGTHLRSVSRALSHARRAAATEEVLASYAELLRCAAAGLGCLRLPRGPVDTGRLDDCLEQAARHYDDVAASVRQGRLDTPGEWPVFGTALTEAERILDEMRHVRARADHACRPAS
ncbi:MULTISPECIES: aromatic acid exporter family protein [unclassified Streptomyces]|uniref:aromatic acid exporter family protein n=1 Tax=unclassified Streptomyces TaxID=2593676 RepID=UPI00369C9906